MWWRLNEKMARLPGLVEIGPRRPLSAAQRIGHPRKHPRLDHLRRQPMAGLGLELVDRDSPRLQELPSPAPEISADDRVVGAVMKQHPESLAALQPRRPAIDLRNEARERPQDS